MASTDGTGLGQLLGVAEDAVLDDMGFGVIYLGVDLLSAELSGEGDPEGVWGVVG